MKFSPDFYDLTQGFGARIRGVMERVAGRFNTTVRRW
jgi:hypothetical protein